MRKSYFVIGSLGIVLVGIILSVLFINQNAKPKPGTVATVNDVAITEQQVNELILHTQVSNVIYEAWWSPKVAENSEIKEISFIFPTDFTSVTKRLVRFEVIRQYLEKQDGLISYEAVCQGEDLTYSALWEDEAFKSTAEKALETFHTTKEQYIDLCYNNSYMVCSAQKAESLFEKSERYDKNSDQSLDEQFKRFVDSLEQQANIVYYSEK